MFKVLFFGRTPVNRGSGFSPGTTKTPSGKSRKETFAKSNSLKKRKNGIGLEIRHHTELIDLFGVKLCKEGLRRILDIFDFRNRESDRKHIRT